MRQDRSIGQRLLYTLADPRFEPLDDIEYEVRWGVREDSTKNIEPCSTKEVAEQYVRRHVGYTVVSSLHVVVTTGWTPNMHLLST